MTVFGYRRRVVFWSSFGCLNMWVRRGEKSRLLQWPCAHWSRHTQRSLRWPASLEGGRKGRGRDHLHFPSIPVNYHFHRQSIHAPKNSVIGNKDISKKHRNRRKGMFDLLARLGLTPACRWNYALLHREDCFDDRWQPACCFTMANVCFDLSLLRVCRTLVLETVLTAPIKRGSCPGNLFSFMASQPHIL
jgi:hypothetical protein